MVAGAAGDMGTATRLRAERALQARQSPDPVDIADLTAELSALMAGKTYG